MLVKLLHWSLLTPELNLKQYWPHTVAFKKSSTESFSLTLLYFASPITRPHKRGYIGVRYGLRRDSVPLNDQNKHYFWSWDLWPLVGRLCKANYLPASIIIQRIWIYHFYQILLMTTRVFFGSSSGFWEVPRSNDLNKYWQVHVCWLYQKVVEYCTCNCHCSFIDIPSLLIKISFCT